MNNLITKIEIDSFRSIRHEQINTGNINIFSGLNDVGKSNVLKALNLFFKGQTDFETDYNFENDYSKISLAAAQRSNKKKQQVKIKVYFTAPISFKSLNSEEVWVERVFDRYGRVTENYSHDDAKKKASITRLINNFQYYYIPALKGLEVLRFILGEVGRSQLISDQDIVNLNDQVNNNVKDLVEILSESAIKNETRFELPVLVRDFWEKLNINTAYDQFSELDTQINPSKKGRRDVLKKEFFQIPLLLRGDGIKSKFIPPLLQWIQKHDPKKFYVWGIDEPENSLEFKKAQEVADLYFSTYAKNSQLFLTSHSLAFIFNKNTNISILRCYKSILGETKFENFQSLFKNECKIGLADEIGALEIQKELIEEWRIKEQQIEKLYKEITLLKKPVIFVEGGFDEFYLKKTLEVFDVTDYPAEIKSIGQNINGQSEFNGKGQLKKAEQFLKINNPRYKVILFYDIDCGEKVKTIENLIIYCPNKINDAKYHTGIEHLLTVPDTFDISKYQITKKEGDKTISSPNKKGIKDYVLALNKKEQKQWLSEIHDILNVIRNIIKNE